MNVIYIGFKIKEKKAIKTAINTEIIEKNRKLHKRKTTFWSQSIRVNN